MSEKKNELIEEQVNTGLSAPVNEPILGFEDVETDDLIVPRVKVIQALSPERKAKTADEGDIINSLTGEKLNGKIFVPVFMFKSNIKWPVNREDPIECMARLGKVGVSKDGVSLACATCRQNEFDNTKEGKDAIPLCSKYINFFGFFKGEKAPIILSFSKTNYNEGKTMISLAKSVMQNMWNYGYRLEAKEKSKNSNSWFVIIPSMDLASSDEDKAFGMTLYNGFKDSMFKFDMNESTEVEPEPDGTKY